MYDGVSCNVAPKNKANLKVQQLMTRMMMIITLSWAPVCSVSWLQLVSEVAIVDLLSLKMSYAW